MNRRKFLKLTGAVAPVTCLPLLSDGTEVQTYYGRTELYSDVELTPSLDLDKFSDQFLRPAMEQLAESIKDEDIQGFIDIGKKAVAHRNG